MSSFDDIRPYDDLEIPAVMRRLSNSEKLCVIKDLFFPEVDLDALREKLCAIQTSRQFQSDIMVGVVESILQRSTSGFKVTGLENISKGKSYLFVSNHRDIVLDAMLLQYRLLKEGHETCNIVFGENLMFDQLFTDLWKVNKMFQVNRGGNPKAFYNSLLHVSEYIRYLIEEQRESVWIAQRNGRTKDGIDITDPALVKMFGMCRHNRGADSLTGLNIVPVSVSYEWESCDKLKAVELCVSHHQKYEKKPGEDFNSIVTGIKQQKGEVHFHICPPIGEADFEALDHLASGEFYKKVADLIDERIHAAYYLYPNNCIAHDLRSGSDDFASQYTPEQRARFLCYMEWMEEYPMLDREELKSVFLGIYANPVDSKLSQHQTVP